MPAQVFRGQVSDSNLFAQSPSLTLSKQVLCTPGRQLVLFRVGTTAVAPRQLGSTRDDALTQPDSPRLRAHDLTDLTAAAAVDGRGLC